MRRLVALLFFLSIAACDAPKPATCPSPAPVAPAQIATVLDGWHDAAAHADEARYFGHFAEGGVFLGTDGKERWTVPEFRAYAHPHFAKGKAWTFRAVRREITFSGDTAWFDEDLDTPHLGPARGSGVLVRDAGGTWKIAQYNLSIPIPNERFAEVKAIIERP
ncbi:MAG TPA: nuclear transport factor 2 family protein [Labilithrix sp.]|jgi:ketosteroid isomerase-like protein